MENKRTSDALLVELVSSIQELKDSIHSVHGELRSHMHDHESNHKSIKTMVAGIETEIKNVLHGFPNDDPELHRAYHESAMERIKARSEFWRKMTFELAKWGLIGFIGWAAWSLWLAFLHGPKQ